MFSIDIKKIRQYFTKSYFKWILWPKITYLYKYKLRWPLMFKYTFDMSKVDSDKYHQNRLKEKDRENQKEREVLGKLIKDLKLFKINFETSGKGNYLGARYRLCVDIDQELVEHCFVHGNSQDEIDYMCQVLTYQIGTEMRRINFKRECYEAQKRQAKPFGARKYIVDEFGNKKEI